jgi:transposase
LCEEYSDEGFCCSYRTVATYVAERRREIYGEFRSALPLEHRYGEAQVDFGEADFVENGTLVHGSYLVVSFPKSNAGFLQLFKGQNLECLLTGLIAVFAHIGGVAAKLWFDNASTIVARILKNGERKLTDGFLRFQEHFGFEAVFCNPASGNEKGNVENKVGYHRRNLLVPIPEFASIEAYNEQLLQRCDADHRREHYRNGEHIETLFSHDREAVMALPRIPFDPCRYQTVRTDAYGKFTLQGGLHRYSTTPKYPSQFVQIRISAHTVSVLDESLREIVTHRRLYGGARQEAMDWLPYLHQLSKRPAALKYTPVYTMMPDMLQQWLSKQPRDAVGKALSLIAELTEHGDFPTTCAALTDSLRQGVSDVDSLVALHDRMTRYAGISVVSTQAPRVSAPQVRFNPNRYDQMLAGGAL